MTTFNITIPKLGESITEATITRWLKKEGDSVKEDESIVEIATDKVDTEVQSPIEGIIKEILYPESTSVKVGELVAIIISNKEEQNITEISNKKEEKELSSSIIETKKNQEDNKNSLYFSPLVKNIAKQEKISFNELQLIIGSGRNNRVTKNDINNYIKSKFENKENQTILNTSSENSLYSKNLNSNDEIIEMDRMRKLIADHMVKSKQTAPHVTSFMEIDVTNLVLWKNRIKESFEKNEKEKITFTPIFIEAVAKAIKNYPMINSSTIDNKIIIKKNINIGMATALSNGNLIVPVIKNADLLNLVGLAKSVNDLANRARSNKLFPEDITEGTFTITNLGTFGTDFGTPIINQPQSAILAIGAIKKKPVVIETPTGDTIGIRNMMYISLAYDHRIIDGALGGYFLKAIANNLVNFDINREI